VSSGARAIVPLRLQMATVGDAQSNFIDLSQPIDARRRSEPLRFAAPCARPRWIADSNGVTAQFDPLRDEGRAYARQLREAGVAVSELHYDDMIHGFFWALDRGKELIAEMGNELRQRLAGSGFPRNLTGFIVGSVCWRALPDRLFSDSARLEASALKQRLPDGVCTALRTISIPNRCSYFQA
jgi:hypothetical protein